MRFVSVALVALIAGGLWYWFSGRHDGAPVDAGAGTAVVGETAAEGTTAEETAAEETAADTTAPARDQVPVPVVVFESKARPASAQLILRGRTSASRNVQVAAETTGRVISEPLRRGAAVSQGEVLCRLDPGIRAAELAEAEAALSEAQVESEAATRLRERGYTAETTLRARQAQLRTAQARLDRVKLDIEKLEIRAPFDGFLESDTAEMGALLSPGNVCANVIDLSRITVTGFVSEQEVDQLSVGQDATAKLINGITATGTISFVSRVADPQTRTYGVEVSIPNADGKLRDGMTAELLIDLAGETGHFLPQSALTLNDEGQLGVRLDQDGVARFVPVTVLRDEAEGFWVTGLPETARVIVIGQEFVKDGRRVKGSTPSWALGQ